MNSTQAGIELLRDMESSSGSPRDLSNQQLDLLRISFEDQDVGLFLFSTQIFKYKDLTYNIHLPISQFLGKWGMSETTKSGRIWTPPTESDGEVTDSWRRLMVRVPRECFKCETEQCIVHTTTGPKLAKDLLLGDHLLAMDGNNKLSSNRVVALSKSVAPVFRLSTTSGVTTEVTANHPFLTVSGYKRLDELKCGDGIAGPRTLVTVEPTGKLPYTAGVMCGDACMTRGTPVVVCFDPEIIETCRVEGASMRNRGRAGYYSLLKESSDLLPDSMKVLSVEKSIPIEYEGSAKFLSGLFDTDGTVTWSKQRGCFSRINLITASDLLARDVQRNLRYFGIISRRRKFRPQGPNGFKGWAWHVNITGQENTEKFHKYIGFVTRRKNQRLMSLIEHSTGPRTSSRTEAVPPEWRSLLRQQARGFSTISRGDIRLLKDAGVRADNSYWTSRDKILESAKILNRPDISDLASEDIVWEEIRSIEPLGEMPIVQMEVSGNHSYLGDLLVKHNTSMATRALSLWTLAKNPDATIGIFNEKEENAQSWVAAIAEVVESSILFQLIWRDMIPPGIGFWDKEKGRSRPRGLKWGATGLKFERPTIGIPELSIEPRGIGGAVTGKHYTHKILDDIIGEKTSDSLALMRDAINWIDHARPLERPAENGQELIVHTPWGFADVYSHILKRWPDEYKVHTRHLLENEKGEPDIANGKSIFPQKISTQKALQMHKTDPFVFSAQYMCIPKAGRTLDFDDSWFHFGKLVYSGREPIFAIDPEHYDPEIYDQESQTPGALETQPPRLVPLSWISKAVIFDPVPGKESERKKETYCRHGIVVVGKDPWGRRFCFESQRSDENETDVCIRILELAQKWQVSTLGIEAVSAFYLYGPLMGFVAERSKLNLPNLIYVEPEGREKMQRIRQDLGPAHQNGYWYYNHEGTAEAIEELTEFPHGTYKDVVDAQSYTDRVCIQPLTPDEARSAWYTERVTQRDRGITGYGEFF